MRSLIDITDFSVKELYDLMNVANDIIARPKMYMDKCRGKKLATLFFEPSTRTRLSFEAAMYELGGNVLGFSDAGSSSTAKGESVADTARVVAGYADIIAMRHPKDGAPLVAASKAGVPIINAGDGGHYHPTQTLADMLTIYREKGVFDGLTIGLCGDLKYGRTVHSLISALTRYENVKFVCICPKELDLPEYVVENANGKNGTTFEIERDLEKAIGKLDILYMTRIQRERFDDKDEYERLKDSYVLTAEKMKKAKADTIVLHPLPRVNEISPDVDDDKRAMYFEQAKNGKFIRMALILKLLEEKQKKEENETFAPPYNGKVVCTNRKCIACAERNSVKQSFKKADTPGKIRCVYCDTLYDE